MKFGFPNLGYLDSVGEVVSDKIVEHEIPTPVPDGTTTVFTVANEYVPGTLRVYLDGLMQIKDVDYTETSSTTFTMTTPPDSDEKLWVGYVKQ